MALLKLLLEKKMAKIKVAVIGAGNLGRVHARIYHELPQAKLVAVCDIDREKAEQTAAAYQIPFFTDYRHLIGLAQAVSICTPTSTHFQLAKEFLQKGLDVLIEKPITTDLGEAEKLLSLARKHGRILQVGHVERFNSAIRAIEKLPGKPKFIEVHRLGQFQPRVKDVGVVLDLMIHDIDIVLGLVKSPLKKIEAVGVKVLTSFEDIANVRLTFSNGTVANLTASRVSEKPMRKIRIFQEDAYISLDYQSQSAEIYRKEKTDIQKIAIDIEKEEPLKKELEAFLLSVEERKKPLVAGEEAKAALALALKILKKINPR
jgi:predicted dehydrogenase